MSRDKEVFDGKVSVVITAAGKGTRMKSDINKQYMEIGGIPVLARTVSIFQQCKAIDDIVLVVNEEDIDYCRAKIVERYNLSKVSELIGGGAERQKSVYRGLCVVGKNSELVLIHDGARPFVSDKNIIDCIAAARVYRACGVGVRLKDTVKICDDNGFVASTPERSSLWSIQTPQGFAFDTIMTAHEKAIADNYAGTDDMVLVERIGIPVKIVEGDYQNIKITTPEDLVVGKAIAAKLK